MRDIEKKAREIADLIDSERPKQILSQHVDAIVNFASHLEHLETSLIEAKKKAERQLEGLIRNLPAQVQDACREWSYGHQIERNRTYVKFKLSDELSDKMHEFAEDYIEHGKHVLTAVRSIDMSKLEGIAYDDAPISRDREDTKAI